MRRLTPLLASLVFIAASVEASAQLTGAAGDRLVAQVIASLQQHATISARLRYQARLDEYNLVGSGEYWQQGTDRQPLSRWEMRTQLGDETASLVQVFDGNYLWTDRRLLGPRRVLRLDIARLNAQLRSIGADGFTASPSTGSQAPMAQGQGGLTQMVADLRRRFAFAPPRSTQLNGHKVDALIGHWRAEQLAGLWPESADSESQRPSLWPKQLPHHVLLLVGKDLFPYVVEQRRAADAHLAHTVVGLRPAHDPLMRYEIFEVQFAAAINPQKFTFQPDMELTDETSLVVERLRTLRAPTAEPRTADLRGRKSQP